MSVRTYKVYVGNLGSNGSKRELEREFERFGRLHDVWVARNPPGFAFVEFEDLHDAEDAIKSLDGARICGERVRVEMARNRSSRGGGSGGGGGGGGRSRSSMNHDGFGGGGRRFEERGSDRFDDRSRSPYRSPPRRRGRSAEGERWGGRGRSRSRSPRRF
ncbi:probable splicing factor, arginine/serine-rich 6 [Acropora muricata]|uniref:probable splicing factor, arginine/serine-rich 6 n=1 Tax=Acropora millepora TaxID=45264 RepID=UPI001CF45F61|nr:probable splicing factor, arginine/serine-rich 6 [Acropora millepora]